MLKKKINLKFWVMLLGFVVLAGLIPFGIQAIATDETTEVFIPEAEAVLPAEDNVAGSTEQADSSSTQNANVNVYWSWTTWEGVVIGDGTDQDEKYFEVPSGTTLTTEIDNGVGYIYNGQKLIATAYPEPWYECTGFELVDHDKKTSNGQLGPITKDMDLQIKYTEIENPTSGILTGWAYDPDHNGLEGVEVYFTIAGSSVTPYYAYTDKNGFYRISNVEFNTTGSLNGYKEGYVAEYSQEFTIDEDYWVDFQNVTFEVGVYTDIVSLLPTTYLHIEKYYSTLGTSQTVKTLAEEGIFHDIKNRQLPVGAKLYVLTKDECKEQGYNLGTLYYEYRYQVGFGTTKYEIYIEPSEPLDIVYWGYSNDEVDYEIVPFKADGKVEITDGVGPYKFYMSQDEMYTCDLDSDVKGHAGYILSYYQNDNLVYGPVEQNDKVALYQNGLTWVDLFGKLHCTLDSTVTNDTNSYEMVLEPVGQDGYSIYNFKGYNESGKEVDLTLEPTTEKLAKLVPEYKPAGNVALAMVEGVDHYTYSLDINGLPVLEDQTAIQDYSIKLFAGTEFDVFDDGSLRIEFENPDDNYTQEWNVEYTTVNGYKINGWTINDMPVEPGMTIEHGGTYIVKANVENLNVPQTSDSTILIFAALAGLAVACFFSTRYLALRNTRS